MASVVSSASDSPALQAEFRGLREIIETLRGTLTIEEKKGLEVLFHHPKKYMTSWKYKLGITNVFESPSYSDSCKKYFAASRIDSELVLLSGGQFLTEEIIVGYIEKVGREKPISWDYVKALMRSSHLSGRIIEAMLKQLGYDQSRQVLITSSAALITPGVIVAWLSKAAERRQSRHLLACREFAVLQIRRAHPEYEGFPDDWVLKVFCGE